MEQITLNVKHTVELTPTAPFNFDATLYKPDHFSSGDNEWKTGIRWHAILWESTYLGLVFTNNGTMSQPKFNLAIWSTQKLEQSFVDRLIAEIEYRCCLQFDLSEFYRNFENEPNICNAIKNLYGMRPVNYRSLYEYLIITIMLQNCNIKRSISMLETLFVKYGRMLSFDGKLLYSFWGFHAIDSITEQELRDLKVGYRAKTIKRISATFTNKNINESLLRNANAERQRTELLKLYGVGPASVGYIMFDVFHNMGELSYISPWEQKIYSKLIFDTNPKHPKPVEFIIKRLEEYYGEYKMLAMHYFWENAFWDIESNKFNWLK